MDFQFDADETGKALKIVSIVDEFTRECVGGMVERSITAPVLREHLDAAPAKQTGPTNGGTSETRRNVGVTCRKISSLFSVTRGFESRRRR
ncbi:hypothetical protein [Mobiluncus porci]|uniref:Integrase catalytic domain-containing protein n=1 Tax=Mobiluncus porci TaxID=2652278 RepID=A0A7K0K039_9ACTO|nr:hypothetical protein [Mobiluncus porci]